MFWDRVSSVQPVPGEEWVYDLCVQGNHNFVAEGMFVHNSNIIDGLLFAFGEMRLKSLRVKSTKDLISKNGNVAEVAVVLAEDDATDFAIREEPGEKGKTRRIFPKGVHEVRRLIRKDGKTKYVLDGRTAKKYVIEDFLSKHNISLQHVIKQGEVQRIVEMNAKDRRALIDFVANVSEYEDKKGEALGELATVDSRLKESRTVFAEKEGYLLELAEDKKNAELYLSLEAEVRKLSATLLSIDVRLMEKQFEDLVSSNLAYKSKVDGLSAKIRQLEEQIDATHKEKDGINQAITEKSQGRERDLQRAIDGLAATIESARVIIAEKKDQLRKMDDRRRHVRLDHQKAGDEVKGFEHQFKQLSADVADVQKLLTREQGDLDTLLKQSEKLSTAFFDARKRMQTYEEDMQACKNELNTLQAEMSRQEELARVKDQELVRLKRGLFDDFGPKKQALFSERKHAEDVLSPFEKELASAFKEEKDINQRLPPIERDITQLRDRIAETESRLRASSEASSGGLEAIMDLRKDNDGIYGTLGELIKYPSRYSVPVAVAMGNRLQYVVVDSVKTAGDCIQVLKSRNLGRVSFIPLDKIHSPPAEDGFEKKAGAVGWLLDLLDFEPQFKKAVAFASGNTLVLDGYASASKHAGKLRMVTLEGELFEPSGLVSGGKTKVRHNPYAEAAKLKDLEAEFEKQKAGRDALVSRLHELRESMSDVRRQKAESELALKRIELEIAHIE
ncbi:MAG: hypothetical protein Q8P02_05355, partial [Candidatus Micrarchaeota archaeon]|nr:hypothetical protein [Candidatus Micrarchaeota archaeon]